MPTVLLPAMRSIRMDSAAIARHRSSARPVMRATFTPASGLNSKVVTTGPGLICSHLAIDAEFGALFHQHASLFAQSVLADDSLLVTAVEQGRGRQLIAADALGNDGDRLDVGVGALAEGDAFLHGRQRSRHGCENWLLDAFGGADGHAGRWRLGQIDAMRGLLEEWEGAFAGREVRRGRQ